MIGIVWAHPGRGGGETDWEGGPSQDDQPPRARRSADVPTRLLEERAPEPAHLFRLVSGGLRTIEAGVSHSVVGWHCPDCP